MRWASGQNKFEDFYHTFSIVPHICKDCKHWFWLEHCFKKLIKKNDGDYYGVFRCYDCGWEDSINKIRSPQSQQPQVTGNWDRRGI